MKTAPRRTLRVVLPILATAAIVVPLTWMWLASRMPSAYSVMSMGYPDYGGVQPSFAEHPEHQSGHGSTPSRSITELIVSDRLHVMTRRVITSVSGSSSAAGPCAASSCTMGGGRTRQPGGSAAAEREQVAGPLHPERHIAGTRNSCDTGPAGGGSPPQRVSDRRCHAALARSRCSECHGRCRRSDPRCCACGR